MPKRYENTKIKKSIVSRGNFKPLTCHITANSTTIYSSIPFDDADIYVITQPGDRLDLLAHQYYGDITLWWYIGKANNLNFVTLDPGIRLRIPATTQDAQGF